MNSKFLSLAAAAVSLTAVLGFASPASAAPPVRVQFRHGILGGGVVSFNLGYPGPRYYNPRVAYYPPAPAPIAQPNYVPPVPGPAAYDTHYHVMFRRGHRDPWREYASYECHELAHEIEMRLRYRGYQARVVHHD